MVRKKIDNRIRVLIENGVTLGHRSMFVVVGDHGKDQVVILHHMLSKAVVKARPSVLWCYKKELGFSSHRKKRMKNLQKKLKSGTIDVNEDDPFELFIAATNIRYCYYSETHKILGNTYGMCVLQDFEAMTPNLLARTIETVEGGGIVVILLRSMSSLKQLYTLSMDVHSRYRTEAHQDVVGRFNERFLLSLATCKRCMVIDDKLSILPLSSHILAIKPVPPKTMEDSLSPSDAELKDLKASLQDTQPVGSLVNCTKTVDQAKAVLKFVEAISEKTLRSTLCMTAARGRGKSAALGIAMATAVAFGYSNIFVTAPSPENLRTLFEFIFKGFDALDYQEHLDYELVQSTNPEFNKAVIRVNIYREHRQTIQYIHPGDAAKLGQAELLVIDEAAAIPLPLVKELLGPYLVFMSSTVNGYEGTGRSLSLKLIQQLRQQNATFGASGKTNSGNSHTDAGSSAAGRVLHEVSLDESIRYSVGDELEQWLNGLLCLDVTNVPRISSGCPLPQDCDLYYINRDTLFSYHKASELFLQRLMAIYVAAHYKNTPNDLQLLSDAPAHHIFCLLGPVDQSQNTLPEILCVLQVCLEGQISKQSIMSSLSRGKRASGDLIPWTISQQFQDSDFPSLSGARVVRIATHPDYQGMGYGSRSMTLLQRYYQGQFPNLGEQSTSARSLNTVENEEMDLIEEVIAPKKNLPPLLSKLSERQAEKLDYLGVSFGLTSDLLRFWKKGGFVPVYLRQTPNDLTGEHSCIMMKVINEEMTQQQSGTDSWLMAFWKDFRRRFVSLCSYQFHSFKPSMALSILHHKEYKPQTQPLQVSELELYCTKYDLQRLELYSRNMADYHLIMDLVPAVARLHTLNRLQSHLSAVQLAILVGLGLQHKSVDSLVKDLDLPATQILALFNRIIRKVVQEFTEIQERQVESQMVVPEKEVIMEPTRQTMKQDLEEAASEIQSKQKKELERLKLMDLSQYSIKGQEAEWNQALKSGKKKSMVSIQSAEKDVSMKRKPKMELQETDSPKGNKKKKKMKLAKSAKE
ncbi:RNA cytidine acetyltransferase-like [Asterias rubens]|uniref:RNA cytidine acetyltransferase-like n=1 Tax=Asterias rubens TaxID=7604 RepID=UPI001455AFDA|nr:RNA cytidine acetyltransferase-like [Asterias rubens]